MKNKQKLDRARALCDAHRDFHGRDFVVRKVHNRARGISTHPYVLSYRVGSIYSNYPIVHPPEYATKA